MAWERCDETTWYKGLFICGCCKKRAQVKPEQNYIICPKCARPHRLNKNKFVEHKSEFQPRAAG
jgi:uncharacterized CHY-type Zn-finger protein